MLTFFTSFLGQTFLLPVHKFGGGSAYFQARGHLFPLQITMPVCPNSCLFEPPSLVVAHISVNFNLVKLNKDLIYTRGT